MLDWLDLLDPDVLLSLVEDPAVWELDPAILDPSGWSGGFAADLPLDLGDFDPALIDVPPGTPDWTPPEVDEHWLSDLVDVPEPEPGPDMGDVYNPDAMTRMLNAPSSRAGSGFGQAASGLGRLLGSGIGSLLGGGGSGAGGGISLPRPLEVSGAGTAPALNVPSVNLPDLTRALLSGVDGGTAIGGGDVSVRGVEPTFVRGDSPGGGGVALPDRALSLGGAAGPSVPPPVPLDGAQSRMGRPEGSMGGFDPTGLSPEAIEQFKAMLVNIPLPQIPAATPRMPMSGLQRLLMRRAS